MLFRIFLTITLPAIGFLTGWRLTERWFTEHRVAFPFERYGLLVGMAGLLWMLGVVLFIWHFSKKRRQT